MGQRIRIYLKDGTEARVNAEVIGSYAVRNGTLTHVLTGRAVPLSKGVDATLVAEKLNRAPVTARLDRLTFGEALSAELKRELRVALDA